MAKEVAIKIKVDGQEVTLAGKQLDSLTNTIEQLKKELEAMGERTEENAEAFDELQGDIEALEKSFEGATKEAKDYNKELNKTEQNVQGVGESAKKTKGGFSAMSAGIKGIGVALKAAGIGLVLSLIAGLFALLKKNQGVVDFFNKAVKTMEILFNRLMEAVKPIGDTISAAFNNPRKAIADLWKAIKENIVNRITGIADTFKFLGKTIKSVFELDWDGVKENAAALGESVTQVLTGIDDLPNKISKGVKAVVDEVTDAVDVADKFIEKENELKLAEADLNKFVASNRAEIEKLRTSVDDINLSTEERIKAAERVNELIEEEENRAIALQEQKIALMKQDMESTQTTIDDVIALKNAEAELDNLRADATSRRLENQNKLNQLRKDDQDQLDADAKAEQERIAKIEEDRKKAAEEELARLTEFRERKRELEEEWALQDAEDANEFYDILAEQEQERFERELENKKLTNEEIEFLEQEHNRNLVEIEQQRADAIKEIDDNQFAAKQARLQQLSGILAQAQTLFKEDTAAYKAIASAQVIIDTARAIMGFTAGYSSLPIVGQALAIAASVTTAALGAAQLAKINKVKFATGGDIMGPLHSSGGVDINAEGGESVINRNSTAMFAPLLSAINQAGGGRRITGGLSGIGSGSDNPVTQTQTQPLPIMKTYVVSNDMTSEQEKEARLKDLSTI